MPDDKVKTEIVEVGAEQAGQRIDNFLIKYMKGVPKTRLYRAIRTGEVRVNGARKKAPYQLNIGDKLRIPPIRRSADRDAPSIPRSLLEKIPVLFEDESLLVVDKPAGLAAHGGTGMGYGLIEALRHLRPELPYVELAHRLDRETSGCLMLAKSRVALVALQSQLGEQRSIEKNYVALLKGAWQGGSREVAIRLAKQRHASGKRMVAHEEGIETRSIFSPRESFKSSSAQSLECTLIDIQLITGRMHQARAHAAHIDQPIAGDYLYGDPTFNRMTKKVGLTRLFLHAESLSFHHPTNGTPIETRAQLPASLQRVLDNL